MPTSVFSVLCCVVLRCVYQLQVPRLSVVSQDDFSQDDFSQDNPIQTIQSRQPVLGLSNTLFTQLSHPNVNTHSSVIPVFITPTACLLIASWRQFFSRSALQSKGIRCVYSRRNRWGSEFGQLKPLHTRRNAHCSQNLCLVYLNFVDMYRAVKKLKSTDVAEELPKKTRLTSENKHQHSGDTLYIIIPGATRTAHKNRG